MIDLSKNKITFRNMNPLPFAELILWLSAADCNDLVGTCFCSFDFHAIVENEVKPWNSSREGEGLAEIRDERCSVHVFIVLQVIAVLRVQEAVTPLAEVQIRRDRCVSGQTARVLKEENS